MRALERFLLLQIIDERWREHLYDMDYLREGIHLRGFAQIDPLVAYKNEAFTLFGDLMNSVWTDFARMIFNVQVNVEGAERRRRAAWPQLRRLGQLDARRARVSYSGGAAPSAPARWPPRPPPPASRPTAPRATAKARRPSCFPSSSSASSTTSTARPQRPVLVRRGKKFKRCHGA